MPEDYFKLFKQAMSVFQHAQMYVYDDKCELGLTIISILISSSLDVLLSHADMMLKRESLGT